MYPMQLSIQIKWGRRDGTFCYGCSYFLLRDREGRDSSSEVSQLLLLVLSGQGGIVSDEPGIVLPTEPRNSVYICVNKLLGTKNKQIQQQQQKSQNKSWELKTLLLASRQHNEGENRTIKSWDQTSPLPCLQQVLPSLSLDTTVRAPSDPYNRYLSKYRHT